MVESPDQVSAYREALARHAATGLDALVELIVRELFASIPAYAEVRSRTDLADIESAVSRSAGLCLATLAEGRPLGPGELVTLHLAGGQRARQGVEREAVLSAVELAERVGFGFLMACAAELAPPDHRVFAQAVAEIRELLAAFVKDAQHALEAGFLEGSQMLVLRGERAEAVLVDRLLGDRWSDEVEIREHAATRGLHASPCFSAVVVPLGRPEERRLFSVVESLRTVSTALAGPIRLDPRPHLPLVVAFARGDRLSEVLRATADAARSAGVTVVTSALEDSILGLSTQYKRLRDDLRFLPAATTVPGLVEGRVVRFQRVVCAGTPADRMEFVHDEIVVPLADVPEREASDLLRTVDLLYEYDGDRAAVAEALAIHKNTVHDRLKRFTALTGLHTGRPRDLVILVTALRMRLVDTDLDAVGRNGKPSLRPTVR